MNITFRQLKVFAAVARHRSFTRAAEELGLSQPAVSMQVKQLENQLDVSLFENLGKKTFLTEAGKEAFQYAREVIRQLEEMENALAGLKGMEKGRLRIAVATTANYFVPTLLGEFCKRFPKVTVSLEVTNRETLLDQLAENETDLVVMGRPPEEADTEAVVFMDNPLVLVAPPGHSLAHARNIPLERLRQEVFLVREPGSGTRVAQERFFSQHDIHITTGMEVGSNEAIKQSVQAGLGLGLLSQDTLEMELTLGRLVILDVQHFPIMRHWYIVHRKGKRLSTVAEAFKQFLVEEAAVRLGRGRPAVKQAV